MKRAIRSPLLLLLFLTCHAFGEGVVIVSPGTGPRGPSPLPAPTPVNPFPTAPGGAPVNNGGGQHRKQYEAELAREYERGREIQSRLAANVTNLKSSWGSPENAGLHQSAVQLHAEAEKHLSLFASYADATAKSGGQWDAALANSAATLRSAGVASAGLDADLDELRKKLQENLEDQRFTAEGQAKLKTLMRRLGELDHQIRNDLPLFSNRSAQIEANVKEYKQKFDDYVATHKSVMERVQRHLARAEGIKAGLGRTVATLRDSVARKDAEAQALRVQGINTIASFLTQTSDPYKAAFALDKAAELAAGSRELETMARNRVKFSGTNGDGQFTLFRDAPAIDGLKSNWMSGEGRQIRYDLNRARATYQILHDRTNDEATSRLLTPIQRVYSDVLVQASIADRLVAQGLKSHAARMLAGLSEKAEVLAGFGKGVLESGKELKELLVEFYEHKGELWNKLSNRYERFLTEAHYSGPDYALANAIADAFSSMKDTAAQLSKAVRDRRDAILFGTPNQYGEAIGRTVTEVASGFAIEAGVTKIAENATFREAVTRRVVSGAVKDASLEAIRSGKLSLKGGEAIAQSSEVFPLTTRELLRRGGVGSEALAEGITGLNGLSASSRTALSSTDKTIAQIARQNPEEAASICSSAIKKAPKLPDIWTKGDPGDAVRNAFTHWMDHKSDFPELKNALEYVEKAHEFTSNPPAGTLSKVKKNGNKVFYNPETNTFAVTDPRGVPRTMYKPDPAQHGYPTNLEYFNVQK